MKIFTRLCLVLIPFTATAALSGCQKTSPSSPQDQFFSSLSKLCGQAFKGQVISTDEADAGFASESLVMHVRTCESERIEIPFHVGDDRSRTWVITKTGNGLRLKHDHRHEDGSEDAVTQYGGDTADTGSASLQKFPVDAHSIAVFETEGLSASVTNTWSVEVSDTSFTYGLARQNRDFRVAFDTTAPVTAPPTPWGHD